MTPTGIDNTLWQRKETHKNLYPYHLDQNQTFVQSQISAFKGNKNNSQQADTNCL